MCKLCESENQEYLKANPNETPEEFAKRLVSSIFRAPRPPAPVFPDYLYETGWFAGERSRTFPYARA